MIACNFFRSSLEVEAVGDSYRHREHIPCIYNQNKEAKLKTIYRSYGTALRNTTLYNWYESNKEVTLPQTTSIQEQLVGFDHCCRMKASSVG